jgi:hypothetical protein
MKEVLSCWSCGGKMFTEKEDKYQKYKICVGCGATTCSGDNPNPKPAPKAIKKAAK